MRIPEQRKIFYLDCISCGRQFKAIQQKPWNETKEVRLCDECLQTGVVLFQA